LSRRVERGRLGDERFAGEGGLQAFHARHVPILVPGRFFRAVEDGERGAQLDGGGDGVVLEEAAQAGEGEGFELAHLVAKAFIAIAADVFDGLFEVGIALEPVVDGRAVDAGGVGSSGNCAAIDEGKSSLGLFGGERADGVRASWNCGSRKSGHREASTTIVGRRLGARGCDQRQVIEKAKEILFGGW
jgi:hypothetical protein